VLRPASEAAFYIGSRIILSPRSGKWPVISGQWSVKIRALVAESNGFFRGHHSLAKGDWPLTTATSLCYSDGDPQVRESAYLEIQSMIRPKFCSGCGERLTAKRRLLRSPRACDNCAKSLLRSRLPIFCALACSLIASFAIGRYTGERKPFYFIGAPVEPLDGIDRAGAPGEADPSPKGEPPASLVIEAPCGARTRSGRPCKRKVRGGGRCWQHRAP